MDAQIFDLDSQKVLDDTDIARLEAEEQSADYVKPESDSIDDSTLVDEFMNAAAGLSGATVPKDEDIIVTGGDEDDKDSEILDETEKAEKTISEKEKGNDAFKEGNFKEAVTHWSRSLRTCKFILSKNVYSDECEGKKEILQLVKALYLNLALGEIKRHNFDSSISYCDEVLTQDPNNIKALFRKADAMFQSSDFEGCITSVDALLALEPSNTSGRQLKAKAVTENRRYITRQKQMMKQMIGKIEADPRSLSIPVTHSFFRTLQLGFTMSKDICLMWFHQLTQLVSFCRRRSKLL